MYLEVGVFKNPVIQSPTILMRPCNTTKGPRRRVLSAIQETVRAMTTVKRAGGADRINDSSREYPSPSLRMIGRKNKNP
jgi:hypothetical protein